eukprot:4013998-Amphidinium_carterae.1
MWTLCGVRDTKVECKLGSVTASSLSKPLSPVAAPKSVQQPGSGHRDTANGPHLYALQTPLNRQGKQPNPLGEEHPA